MNASEDELGENPRATHGLALDDFQERPIAKFFSKA
jgi:hypothetical protein